MKNVKCHVWIPRLVVLLSLALLGCTENDTDNVLSNPQLINIDPSKPPPHGYVQFNAIGLGASGKTTLLQIVTLKAIEVPGSPEVPAVIDETSGEVITEAIPEIPSEYFMPDFNQEGAVENPTRRGFVFSGWSSTSTKANGNIADKKAAGDPIKFSETGGLRVYAIWDVDGEDTTFNHALEILSEIESGSGAIAYTEDFAVSNGEGFDLSYLAAVSALREALFGEELTQPVEVEGVDEEGNPLTEDIFFISYDFDAIIEATNTVKAMKNDPAVNKGADGLSTIISIASIASKNTKVSPPLPSGYRAQTILINRDGEYEFDLYGASGGHIWSRNNATSTGGKGAHLTKKLSLSAGTVVTVKVGQEGAGTATYDEETHSFSKIEQGYQNRHAGGFGGGPGGAGGSSYGDFTAGGSGGGGATEVVVNGVREIVAGGGGGAAQSAKIDGRWPGLDGGDADTNGYRRGPIPTTGVLIQNGGTFLKILNGYYYGIVPSSTASTTDYIQGGSGGAGADGEAGDTGRGYEGTGGGGGGYVGGAAHKAPNLDNTSSGAGGKSYPLDARVGLNNFYGDGKITVKYIGPKK
ncbi:MAG: hypothetical protein Ta2G_13170 [Termitinemataceae bacterium]|nr:MAG: hypothetical protein Ta2G_13170 [Termitinemataceae bacterium]